MTEKTQKEIFETWLQDHQALLLLDGFSYKEMAAMLGISESNVGVKIHRIKQRLTARAQKSYPHGF